jgi:CheY-like chemotaxis protein
MMPPAMSVTVLLVDRYDEERELFAECLAAMNFSVTAVANHDEPDGALWAATPHVAVLRSWSLTQDSEAVHTARVLRSASATRDIPIVMLTTDSTADHQIAFDAGCSSVLLLPVLPNDLAAAIYTLVDSAA